MCRWLAYRGEPIFLSELLFEPENSLIDQSLHAREAIATTNGDGFGIGWYDARPGPGLFRDVLPAWNDDNLRSLAEQIRSGLFLAHVRASTGTGTARQNCHPFRHGRWLFMHNGQIGGYTEVRRRLEMEIAPELYRERLGTTDTEAMFLLALTYGLESAPETALRRMVGTVEALMADAGAERPLRISLAATDAEHIIALRYSSDRRSPSLYLGLGGEALAEAGLVDGSGDPGVLVLSEPLDDVSGNWQPVEEASLVVAGPDGIAVTPFQPEAP
jgi:glutamine amidotransferase